MTQGAIGSLKILCIIVIMGIVFSIFNVGDLPTVHAQAVATNTPTPTILIPTTENSSPKSNAIQLGLGSTRSDNIPYLGMTFNYPDNWNLQSLPYMNFGFRISSPDIQLDPIGHPLAGAYISAEVFLETESAWANFVTNHHGEEISISGYSAVFLSISELNTMEWHIYAFGRHHIIWLTYGGDYKEMIPVLDEIVRNTVLTGLYEPMPQVDVQKLSVLSALVLADFSPLKQPFSSGPGKIINGYDDNNHHSGGDLYAFDLCQMSGCSSSAINDIVIAPTNLTLRWTGKSNNQQTANDFHIFEITSDSTVRLCMSMGHFRLTDTRFGLGTSLPQGAQIGRIVDYVPNIEHIHMGLYTVPITQGCADSNRTSIAIPYDENNGGWTLDGVNYPITTDHTGEAVNSTNAPLCAVPAVSQSVQGQKIDAVSASVVGCDDMGPLYATTPSGLWQIDPFTGSGSLVKSLSYSFTDIAFDGRTLYGITFSQLFSVNPVTGVSSLIGSIGYGDVNALTIGYDGTLYAGQVNGSLLRINKSTGAGTLVGYYGSGISSSGDLAILYGNVMYASVTRSGYATDWLAQINMSNGKATLIGSLGESAVYGLDFIDGSMYGVTESGYILKINAATGASTRIKALSGNFWGLSTNFPIGPVIDPTPVKGNFYGDGRDETGIFDSGNGTWYIKGKAPFVYGQSGDIPVPADYNGDGRDEFAVFRPGNSTWYIRGIGPALYGTVGDIPVVADYNGDGKADIAVFRPTNSTWYIQGVGPAVYGTVGDIPVVADYNGDGKADIAVFRPTNSTWYIRGTGPSLYGTVGDIPVVADYNGDGKADIAVFRPSNSTWYLYGIGPAVYGTVGDIPVIGDYNGDGRADIAVFRPSNYTFYLRAIGIVVY